MYTRELRVRDGRKWVKMGIFIETKRKKNYGIEYRNRSRIGHFVRSGSAAGCARDIYDPINYVSIMEKGFFGSPAKNSPLIILNWTIYMPGHRCHVQVKKSM